MSCTQVELADDDVQRELDGLNDLDDAEFEDEVNESWLR